MKDPAVLFYTQDFLTGTFLMTDAQVGKYIRLLCLQQQNGGLSEKEMLKICGEKDDEIWAKFECENGHYFNKRMLIETKKRKEFTEGRLKNLSHMDSHVEICNKKDEIRNKNKEVVFKSEVFEFSEKYPEAMLNKFCNYWTEKNKNGKLRFEFEKTFEISRRLATWASRDKDIQKTIQPLTYDEMLEKSKFNPDFWKDYKAVLRPGERKAVYYPINSNL
jgi:hypothetical protein